MFASDGTNSRGTHRCQERRAEGDRRSPCERGQACERSHEPSRSRRRYCRSCDSQASGKVINWSTKPLNSPPVSQHIWFQAGHVNAHGCHEPAGVTVPGVAVVDASICICQWRLRCLRPLLRPLTGPQSLETHSLSLSMLRSDPS